MSGDTPKNKGGRPKATAKHMAVFLARLHFTEKLGKTYLADAELMDLFGVSEPRALRSMVAKAEKTAKRGVTMRHPDGWAIWSEGHMGLPAIAGLEAQARSGKSWRPADRKFGMPIPTEGGEGWMWREGMTTAVPVIIRNVRHSISWEQTEPSGRVGFDP